jgi:hypothetical protein
MQQSKLILPALTWSIDNYSAKDNTGTVYSEGSGDPDLYDVNMRYPEYMAYIRSSDFAYAEFAARAVYDRFHKFRDQQVTISKQIKGQAVVKQYQVYLIQALSEPLRIGVDDAGIMEWSVNFRATLREVS